MPALVVLLVHAEKHKGSPLTQQEVLAIRDKGACIMMRQEHAISLAEKRGYDDLDPERVWEQWQEARAQMANAASSRPSGPTVGADHQAKYTQEPLEPQFMAIRDDDPAFQQAIRDAQASLAEFRGYLRRPNAIEWHPCIKALLTAGDARAFMWLLVVRDTQTGFEAAIFEIPPEYGGFKVGDQVRVADSDVMDWMVNEGGVLRGGFSLRYQRSLLPPDKHAWYDQHIGVTEYA